MSNYANRFMRYTKQPVASVEQLAETGTVEPEVIATPEVTAVPEEPVAVATVVETPAVADQVAEVAQAQADLQAQDAPANVVVTEPVVVVEPAVEPATSEVDAAAVEPVVVADAVPAEGEVVTTVSVEDESAETTEVPEATTTEETPAPADTNEPAAAEEGEVAEAAAEEPAVEETPTTTDEAVSAEAPVESTEEPADVEAPTETPVEEAPPAEVEVVDAPTGEEVILDDDYADQVTQLNADEDEMDKVTEDQDDLEEVAVGLESLIATMEQTKLAGGMRPTEAAMAQQAFSLYCKRVNVKPKAGFGLESFNTDFVRARLIGTTASIESVADTAKEVWEMVKRAFEALKATAMKFLSGLFDYVENAKQKVEALRKRVDSFEGQIPPVEIELSQKAANSIQHAGKITMPVPALKSTTDYLSLRHDQRELRNQTATRYLEAFSKLKAVKDHSSDEFNKLLEETDQLGLVAIEALVKTFKYDGDAYVTPVLIGDIQITARVQVGSNTAAGKLLNTSVEVIKPDTDVGTKFRALSLNDIGAVLDSVSASLSAISEWTAGDNNAAKAMAQDTVVNVLNRVLNDKVVVDTDVGIAPLVRKTMRTLPKLWMLDYGVSTKAMAALRNGIFGSLEYVDASLKAKTQSAPAKA